MSQAQSYEYLWGTQRWRVLREKLVKMDFTAGERRIAAIRAECERQCQVIALQPVLCSELISIIDSCVVDGRYSAERASAVVLPDLSPFEEVILPFQRSAGRPRKEGNKARMVNPSIRNAMAAILIQPQLEDTEKLRRDAKRGFAKKGKARASRPRARTGGSVREISVPVISLETVSVVPDQEVADAPMIDAIEAVQAVEPVVEPAKDLMVTIEGVPPFRMDPRNVTGPYTGGPIPKPVFSAAYLRALEQQANYDPMDTSEMSGLELIEHHKRHRIPVRLYPDLFTVEQEQEMAALTDRSVWPGSYDHDWAKDWPESPLDPMPLMVEEFPHFGLDADEPFAKWHKIRDEGRQAGRRYDVEYKEIDDPIGHLSEETAWNWVGPVELPRPLKGPRVSPNGMYFSLGNPINKMAKDQRLRRYRGSAKTCLHAHLLKYTELATMNVSHGRLFGFEFDVNWCIEQESNRQRFWPKVVKRADLIRYGMVRFGLGQMTFEAVRAQVFQFDFDAMAALVQDESTTYVTRMLDKLPWPPGFSRRELVVEFGHGQGVDEIMDTCQSAFQTRWQKARSDAADTLVGSDREYEMIYEAIVGRSRPLMAIKEHPDQESIPFEPIYNEAFHEAMLKYPNLKAFEVRDLLGMPPVDFSKR